jgi:hypothetical protein
MKNQEEDDRKEIDKLATEHDNLKRDDVLQRRVNELLLELKNYEKARLLLCFTFFSVALGFFLYLFLFYLFFFYLISQDKVSLKYAKARLSTLEEQHKSLSEEYAKTKSKYKSVYLFFWLWLCCFPLLIISFLLL